MRYSARPDGIAVTGVGSREALVQGAPLELAGEHVGDLDVPAETPAARSRSSSAWLCRTTSM
jgi:hypothetical protein